MGLALPVMPASCSNHLLGRLSRGERAKVLSSCQAVQLRLGETLAMPGERLEHVYFPTSGFISLLAPTNARGFLEIALVGVEGLCGASVVLGADRSSVRAEVRGEGTAWRMQTAAFRREIEQLPRFRATADLYVHVLMSQLGQSAGCSGSHLVERRVATWLLTTSDRADSTHVSVTHERLGHLLGVRRVGVTEAMGTLQASGLIQCERGLVMITNRKGLEAAACSCMEANRAIFRASFPEKSAGGAGSRQPQANEIARAANLRSVDDIVYRTSPPTIQSGAA